MESEDADKKKKYEGLADRELMLEYRITRDSEAITVMIKRYRNLMLKIIGQWHSKCERRIYMTPSDMNDTVQCANLGLMLMMNNVVDIQAIKNVGSRLKGYIEYVLNTTFGYRKYEIPAGGNNEVRNRRIEVVYDEPAIPYNRRVHIFIGYSYDYYKLGLMMSGSKTRKSMKAHVQKIKAKVCTDELSML